MRTYTKRPKAKKLTAEQEQAWRRRLITAVNEAHGYSITSLEAMTTKKLVSLRNRIGSHQAPSRSGKLPANRHYLKIIS